MNEQAPLNPQASVEAATAERIAAEAAYTQQQAANEEARRATERRVESEAYAGAYVAARGHLHAEPERMPFGHEAVRAAQGWEAKVHTVAHMAGEQAGQAALAEHQAGVAAELALSQRARDFEASNRDDDWTGVVRVLDEARATAERTDDWNEFDALFGKLRTGERSAYTNHAIGPETSTSPSPAPQPAPQAPQTGQPESGSPAPETRQPEPATTEPTTEQPGAPEPGLDDAQRIPVFSEEHLVEERPVVGAPYRMNRDGSDPTVVGHRTWTAGEVSRAEARRGGEHAPEPAVILSPSYFGRMEGLPKEALDLLDQYVKLGNPNLVSSAHRDAQRKITQLNEELTERYPRHAGLADMLRDVYSPEGRFAQLGTQATAQDVALIKAIHRYKTSPNDSKVLAELHRLRKIIDESEKPVPVNFRQHPDGTITAIDGPTVPKSQWIIRRHIGNTHAEAARTDNPELIRPQNIGHAALRRTVGVGQSIRGGFRRLGRGLARGANTVNPARMFRPEPGAYNGRTEGDWLIPPPDKERPGNQPPSAR